MRRLLVIGCLSLAARTARADQEGRILPYQIESADGRFVFVMAKHCWPRQQGAEEEPIGPYTKSGLYKNDGSTIPLWTVDWCGRVLLPSDGIHVIRSGPWASWGGDEAFSFYSRGRLLRTYRVGDLVDWPELLPHSVSHLKWLRSLNPEGSEEVYPLVFPRYSEDETSQAITARRHAERIVVRTLHGDSYVFALGSGGVVSRRRPLRTTVRVLVAASVLVYVVYVVMASGRRPRPLRKLLLRIGPRAILAGWAVTWLGIVGAVGLIDPLAHVGGHSWRFLLGTAFWQAFFWLPYQWVNHLLRRDYGLAVGGGGVLLVFAFWLVTAAVVAALSALVVALLAWVRGHTASTAEQTGLRGLHLIKRSTWLLTACVASLWLVAAAAAAQMTSRAAFLAIVAVAVAGPLVLLCRQRAAARRARLAAADGPRHD